MSNVVFILGAGASKQCGAPLMADFLDVSLQLFKNGQCEDTEKDFKRVFNTIGNMQQIHSKAQIDLNNIESIFSALEIANILHKLPRTDASDIPLIIASLKKVIVKTLELTIEFPYHNNKIQIPRPYETFTELIKFLQTKAKPQQKISVITFNYDIAVDYALNSKNINYDYHLPQNQNSSINNSIPLLKLHGSLNWGVKEDGKVIEMPLNTFFTNINNDNISIRRLNQEKQYFIHIGSNIKDLFLKLMNTEVENEPFIVPPTWNKADHHYSLSSVWETAARQLEEAEYIFIIGYSLPETDAFFRLLYALGTVGQNLIRKFIVFNPDSTGQVDARFKNMLGPGAASRYEYRAVTFTDAIGHIYKIFE